MEKVLMMGLQRNFTLDGKVSIFKILTLSKYVFS